MSAEPDGDAPRRAADLDPAEVVELLALVDELDADNERLRTKFLDLLPLMEEAVTAQVAGERRIAELEARLAAADQELAAVHSTRLMRVARPLRSAYRRLRGWLGRRSGEGVGDA